MQVPTILRGKRPFDLITGGIAGAILIIAVGFNWTGYGFGWCSAAPLSNWLLRQRLPLRSGPIQCK
jgi:hypothetical protein